MQKIMHQKNDLIHTVETKTFRIVELISEGGFSVVYRAEEIIGEETCPVLLKAYSMDLSISERSEWESIIRHELQMNRKISKCGFAGALTMEYTVHEQQRGRVYGVMPAEYPGKTLREYVDSDEWKHSTLRDRMVMGKRLFRLISNFHKKCGIIHGDINPDNIYLLDTDNDGVYERNAVFALLDFGVSQEAEDPTEAVLGYTEGYARQDIVNGSRTRFLELDDWYAMLHCFWYCFSGHTVEEFPVTLEHIEQMHRQLSVRYESVSFTNEEEKELLQMREEHTKVVGKLLRKIFLNMDILTDSVIDLVEQVLGILDDTGINRERLFSKLLEEYKSLRTTRFAGLDIVRRILPNAGFEMSKGTARFYRQKSNKPEPLQRIMKSCKDSLFMVGDGGMGKTTSLISIMDDTYGDDIDVGNPVIFMELCTLSQNYEEWYSPERGGTFIEQFVASYFTKEPRKYVAADHPYISPLREELFRSPQRGIRQYTLLLDGLNEIGFINDKSRKIFFEVLNYYLKYAKNLRIILTGRSDTYELSSESLLRIHTEGLDDIHIEGILLEAVEKKSLSENDYHRIILKRHEMISNEYRLWQCLRTPFFLMMYCMMSEKRSVTRQGEILKNFFHDKRETLDGNSVYGEKQQAQKKQQKKKYGDRHDLRMDLSIRIVLDFVVPEIACKMVMDNLYFIELKDVKQVIRDFLKTDIIRETYQNWRKWFYGYEINVQEVLNEINRIDGGDRIPQYACEVLGIMRETANGTLFFTHQYFRDYFAACAFVNRMLLLLEARGMGSEMLVAGDAMFEKLIYPFQEKKLSPYIAALIGEILGECRNLPVYRKQDGQWMFAERIGQEQMVLSQLLDCYRLRRGMEWSYTSAMGLYNLFAIFKSSRVQNDGRVDLSGLSLNNLNLRNISLSGVVLSRFNRNGEARLATDFENSAGALDAFLYDESITHMQCLAVHPAQKRILLRDRANGTVTEADLEHGETTLICEHMEKIRYASYCQKSDEILLVTYLPGTAEKNRKKSYMDRFLEFMRVDEPDDYADDDFLDEDVYDYNDYDPRIFADEEDEEEETCVYTFHRSTGLVLSTRLQGEKPVACQWSEDFQELSIMLQNPIKEMSLVKGSFSVKNREHEKQLRMADMDSWIFDPESLDMDVLGMDAFAFNRISETEYIFTDFETWNGDVGVWNIKNGNVQSICYKNKEKNGGSLAAICGYRKAGSVYALKCVPYHSVRSVRGMGHVEHSLYKYKEDELAGYPLQKNFALQTSKGCQIEFLQEQMVLCLSNNKLQMISLDKENAGWVSQLYVQEYIRSDAGYLIATCDDGLYEINILDGSTTCIQKFMKKRVSFVIGKTSSVDAVVLLESTGIVKWLDIHTGCCSRFATIQGLKFTSDFQIYADEANHIIIAVSDIQVSVWESYSGAFLRSYTVELPKGEILLGKEIIDGDIVFYFEHRNYDKFPMEQLYYCKIWNVEKAEWEKGELPPILKAYKKDPFRLHLSEDGSSFAIECVDENAKTMRKYWNNPKKKRFLDKFADMIHLEESDEEEGFVRKQSYWKQSSWIQDKKRSILYQSVKGHQRNVDVLEPDEVLLGLTSHGVMYMKTDDEDENADIYVANEYRQVQYGFGEVEGTINNAFTVKDTLVMHVSDSNHTRSRILFWNMADKNIYGYNATENLMITGCKSVTEPEPQAKNRKTLLEMQGIGNPIRHVIGKVRVSEEERESVLNKLKDRMKSWNVPALICSVLLCVLSAVILFGTDALASVREYRGNAYYVERLLSMLASFLVVMVCTKLFLPYFMKVIKREKFFGIGGVAVIAMFCVASAIMTSPELIVFWVRIDVLLMLWIPLACWCSLNRPKRKLIWFLLLTMMVVAFMCGTLLLNEYYSTTYLLQLVLTALATVVTAEFIRNRRSFWVGVAKIAFVLAASAASLWFTLRSQGASLRLVNVENSIRDMEYWWGSLNYHCQQVLQHAKLFGASEMEYLVKPVYRDVYSMDYLPAIFHQFPDTGIWSCIGYCNGCFIHNFCLGTDPWCQKTDL